jgi:hypothetical protein
MKYPHLTIFSIKELRQKVKTFTDNIPKLEEKRKLILQWQEAIYSGKVYVAKEEELRPDFLHTFFGNILEYEYQNAHTWQLQLESKTNIDSTKADAALGFFRIKEGAEFKL